jgi:hypothetical protein
MAGGGGQEWQGVAGMKVAPRVAEVEGVAGVTGST